MFTVSTPSNDSYIQAGDKCFEPDVTGPIVGGRLHTNMLAIVYEFQGLIFCILGCACAVEVIRIPDSRVFSENGREGNPLLTPSLFFVLPKAEEGEERKKEKFGSFYILEKSIPSCPSPLLFVLPKAEKGKERKKEKFGSFYIVHSQKVHPASENKLYPT